MDQLLPFLVVGLTTGSVYGIAGMGLVLTYKTSGVFNFAHGAVAAVGAYAFYTLHVEHGVAWPLALAVCLGVAAPLAGLALERVARLLAGSSATNRIVASVGLLLAIQGAATVVYGAQIRSFPQFLPRSTFSVGDVAVGWDQLIVMLVAAGSAAWLYVFFRRTRLGLAMQAVVDDPDLLALTAVDPKMTRRSAWIIGSMFAALSGVLIAPSLGLDAFFLTLLVVQAFGGAAIGRFSSLPLTYAGGIVVGVAGAVSQKYAPTVDLLRGLPPSVPFIVLFGALLLYRRGSFAEAGVARRLSATEPEPWPRAVKVAFPLVVLAALVAVPSLVGPDLPVYTSGVTFVMIFLALGLLVWTSGQISLCQAAFAAVGATTLSHLTGGVGLPWLPALILAGLAAVPVGALIAIPSIRLSGVYLALATFGFGILMERMAFGTGLMFGGNGSRSVPRPSFWFVDPGSDRAFYYVVLAIAVATAAFVVVLVPEPPRPPHAGGGRRPGGTRHAGHERHGGAGARLLHLGLPHRRGRRALRVGVRSGQRQWLRRLPVAALAHRAGHGRCGGCAVGGGGGVRPGRPPRLRHLRGRGAAAAVRNAGAGRSRCCGAGTTGAPGCGGGRISTPAGCARPWLPDEPGTAVTTRCEAAGRPGR